MTADALTAPTWFIDSDSAEVGAFVVSSLADAEISLQTDTETATAVALFSGGA
jgi:hypothetical protein